MFGEPYIDSEEQQLSSHVTHPLSPVTKNSHRHKLLGKMFAVTFYFGQQPRDIENVLSAFDMSHDVTWQANIG